jgi:hypothetical protein
MTDNSQNFDSLKERNEQVLNNISQLQTQEKKLYDSLDDVTLSSDQKQQVINKINEISQMRLNMYASMKDMYSFFQKNVTSSSVLLEQEMTAIDVIENELNEAKKRINVIDTKKNNKLRLVEINTYYGKRYNAHSRIMKSIILTCIPILILTILSNYGILPPNLYMFLVGIVIIVGVIIIGYQIIDISNRDNMNWDEYDWYFDRAAAPSDSTVVTDGSKNPWENLSLTCIGSACCYEGSTYDNDTNICVPNTIYSSEHPEVSQTTESFKGLGKYANTQTKPISISNNIMPSYSSLFKSKF